MGENTVEKMTKTSLLINEQTCLKIAAPADYPI